jgi:hypothetical protein
VPPVFSKGSECEICDITQIIDAFVRFDQQKDALSNGEVGEILLQKNAKWDV